MLESGVRWRLW